MTTHENADGTGKSGLLAFHILPRRVMNERRALTQVELAHAANISVRKLRRLETARVLPRAVADNYALAVALGQQPEGILAPEHLARIRCEVNGRLQELGLSPSRVMHRPVRRRVLAVCPGRRTIGYAVVEPERVVFPDRQDLRHLPASAHALHQRRRTAELIRAFNCEVVVTEPNVDVPVPPEFNRETLHLSDAAELVLPRDGRSRSKARLYRHVVEQYPGLGHHVTTLRTGEVALSDSDTNTVLRAAALGLAFHRKQLLARYSSNSSRPI